MLSHLNKVDLSALFLTEWERDLDHSAVKKSPHESNSFRCEGISKFGKFTKILNKDKPVKKMLFLGILLTLSVLIFFMIFQLIPTVLLTPTNFCFHDKVITLLPGVFSIKWWPLNIGICVYWKELRNVKLYFTHPWYYKKCKTNRGFLIFHSLKGIRTKTRCLKN